MCQLKHRLIGTAWLLAGLLSTAWAQAPAAANANDIVRQVVQNELRASDNDHSHWTYRLEKKDENGVIETREVIDTVNGSLYKQLAINGRSLTPAQQQADEQRLQHYINDPDAQARKARARKDDAEKAKQMLKLLPDAFNYSVASEAGDILTLKFTPNPNFDPPNREAQVYHAMDGTMVVDRREMRLVRLAGSLMDDVTFGWGILGRLQKGGTFDVQQLEVAPGIWLNRSLDVNMHGKAVFFKTINVQQHEASSDFQRVPDNLTLAQAAQRLEEDAKTSSLARK